MPAIVKDKVLVAVAASNAPPTTWRNAMLWLCSNQTAPADTATKSSVTASGATSTFSLIEIRLSKIPSLPAAWAGLHVPDPTQRTS